MDGLLVGLLAILGIATAAWFVDTRSWIRTLEADYEQLEAERDMCAAELDDERVGIDDRRRIKDLIGAVRPAFSNDMIQKSPRRHRRYVPGYVYLIRVNDEFCKIGYTNRIQQRLNSMQIGSPYKIELVHAICTEHAPRLEVVLHQRYADKWTSGEWFRLSTEDIDAIRTIPSPVTIKDLEQFDGQTGEV